MKRGFVLVMLFLVGVVCGHELPLVQNPELNRATSLIGKLETVDSDLQDSGFYGTAGLEHITDEEFFFVTSNHLIPHSPKELASIRLRSTVIENETYPIRVVGRNPARDLAVIAVPRTFSDLVDIEELRKIIEQSKHKEDITDESWQIGLVGFHDKYKTNIPFFKALLWDDEAKWIARHIMGTLVQKDYDSLHKFSRPFKIASTKICPVLFVDKCYVVPVRSWGYSGGKLFARRDEVDGGEVKNVGVVSHFGPQTEFTYIIPSKVVDAVVKDIIAHPGETRGLISDSGVYKYINDSAVKILKGPRETEIALARMKSRSRQWQPKGNGTLVVPGGAEGTAGGSESRAGGYEFDRGGWEGAGGGWEGAGGGWEGAGGGWEGAGGGWEGAGGGWEGAGGGWEGAGGGWDDIGGVHNKAKNSWETPSGKPLPQGTQIKPEWLHMLTVGPNGGVFGFGSYDTLVGEQKYPWFWHQRGNLLGRFFSLYRKTKGVMATLNFLPGVELITVNEFDEVTKFETVHKLNGKSVLNLRSFMNLYEEALEQADEKKEEPKIELTAKITPPPIPKNLHMPSDWYGAMNGAMVRPYRSYDELFLPAGELLMMWLTKQINKKVLQHYDISLQELTYLIAQTREMEDPDDKKGLIISFAQLLALAESGKIDDETAQLLKEYLEAKAKEVVEDAKRGDEKKEKKKDGILQHLDILAARNVPDGSTGVIYDAEMNYYEGEKAYVINTQFPVINRKNNQVSILVPDKFRPLGDGFYQSYTDLAFCSEEHQNCTHTAYSEGAKGTVIIQVIPPENGTPQRYEVMIIWAEEAQSDWIHPDVFLDDRGTYLGALYLNMIEGKAPPIPEPKVSPTTELGKKLERILESQEKQ